MSREPKPNAKEHELQSRNRELSILNTFAGALNRQVDLTQSLRAALAQVAESLDLKTGWVWLLTEHGGESYLAASQNLPPGLVKNPQLMEGTCYCLNTYMAGDLEGAANVNVVTCSRLKQLVDGTDGLRYHASIPLYGSSSEHLGVLNVASTDWRELTADDLRLLHTIGDLLSIAIQRTRLFEHSVELGAVEERNRLAREIHDTLAQGLAAIALQLETAEAHLEAGPDLESVRQAVTQALTLTQGNLEEARRSVLDLRAALLEGRTLIQALRLLTEQQSREKDVVIDLETIGAARPLPNRVEAGLYRIAQEALTNAVKHATASKILVRLVTTPQEIELVVEDNGKGFEPSAKSSDRYGLIGINERAKLLGGRARLSSTTGVGTRISVQVPLEKSTPGQKRDN